MKKIILLDDYFSTGEQTVQPAVLWHNGKAYTDALGGGIAKTAGEALDYVKNVSAEPGKTLALVLALGAEETYGPNRNGDGFPESPIKKKNGNGYAVKPGETLVDHYKTFEGRPSHMHHQNKDPSKGTGEIKKAFWNPKMHRVELLVSIDNTKDAEWVQKMNDGEYPAVSMACRIKYDTCSICQNEAPTRREYCDHAKFSMNQLLPDGRRIYVHNPSPNFFEISRVFRPADKTGYTLKKVAYEVQGYSSAELGEYIDQLDAKRAAISKISDIKKIIDGESVAYKNNMSPSEGKLVEKYIDYKKSAGFTGTKLNIEKLATFKTPEVLGFLKAGSPSFIDLTKFFATKMGESIPANLDAKLASLQSLVFSIFEAQPNLLDDICKTGSFSTSTPDKETTEKLSGLMSMVARKFLPEGSVFRGYEKPTTDMLTVSSPDGHQYATTRGAATDAHDAMVRAQMKKTVGGAAMLAGGYQLLNHAPGLNSAMLPAAAIAGATGAHMMLPDYSKNLLKTDQGDVIPAMTENIRTASVVDALIQDKTMLNSKEITQKISKILEAGETVTAVDSILQIKKANLDELASFLGGLVIE